MTLELSNLEKIYWPKEKYTKGDLIEYYRTIAPYILPYLKKRAVFLHRYPEGIEGLDFYQKDIKPTKGIKTVPVKHEGKIINYLLIDNVTSLLYAINLGSIDLHPFMARIDRLENPDYCVIDLDPRDVSFEKVVETALEVHDLLDKIKVAHFCKTSGGKGLHIVIPLQGKYNFEQSRQFAEVIAQHVHEKLPDITSLERSPKKREGKVYLDCLQNRTGQTIIPPYAVRPRPGAKVSTPLEWKELNKKLDPSKFNINTIAARLKKKGDLFLGVLKKGINMKKALDNLTKL